MCFGSSPNPRVLIEYLLLVGKVKVRISTATSPKKKKKKKKKREKRKEVRSGKEKNIRLAGLELAWPILSSTPTGSW
jgi:hypothetical protein